MLGFSRPPLEGDPPNFAMPQRDGFIMMLYEADAENPFRPRTGDLWDAYFWIGDADGLLADFRTKGADIVYDSCVQRYGIKEFAVRDPDEHILTFGQHWEGR